MIIIYGTASSGKSNIAEDLAVEFSGKNGTDLVYFATMESVSDAAKKRITKHRMQREGKGFDTIEELYSPGKHIDSLFGKTVLLECVSNLCANIYFRDYPNGAKDDSVIDAIACDIVKQIIEVSNVTNGLFVVSNDVFSDGIKYDEWTDSFMKLLALTNKKLAKECTHFYEVINGNVVKVK